MAIESKKEAPQRIYSTTLINQIVDDLQHGYEIDTTPFFQTDVTLRNANITFKMTDDEYEEYVKCFNEPVYFISKYCAFLTDTGRHVVELRDYQIDLIHTFADRHYDSELNEFIPNTRNAITMASRQTGKTTTTAAYMVWYLCFNTDRNIGVMANKQKTAIEIVEKIQEMFRGIPYFLKPGVINWGQMGVSLDNGCRLISSATTKTASIGFTLNGVLYIDEMAHVPNNIMNAFWKSVYPTLSSSKTAQCFITSTPNGVDNKFFDIWDDANRGKNSFKPTRIDYWRVPEHDDEWAAAQRKDLGEEEFAQEFELSFNANSVSLISIKTIEYLYRIKKEYINKTIYGMDNYFLDDNIKWNPDFDPNDMTDDDKFVLSIDLAQGKEDGSLKDADYNVINIFKIIPNSIANMRRLSKDLLSIQDAFRLYQVGVWRDNNHDESYSAKIAKSLVFGLFNKSSENSDNVRIMVEMNFQGKNWLTNFQNDPNFYDNIIIKTYHRQPIPGEVLKKKPGFVTTSTKGIYCKKGIKLLDNKKIIVNEENTIKELQSFGVVKGKMKGIGTHDDLAVTVIHNLARLYDEDGFIEWLDEILFNMPDSYTKYQINELIKKWAYDNPEMDDDSFNSIYAPSTEDVYIRRSVNKDLII